MVLQAWHDELILVKFDDKEHTLGSFILHGKFTTASNCSMENQLCSKLMTQFLV